jgi:uncharacterized membrane protein
MSAHHEHLPDDSRSNGAPEGPGLVGVHQHFSGPLPPPALLKQYDDVAPGAAERILKKFESQTDHRIRLESVVVWTGSIKELGGLVCGFIIAMTAIIGGIYTALQGLPFLGGSLSFTGLAALVGAFLMTTFWQPEEEAGVDPSAST